MRFTRSDRTPCLGIPSAEKFHCEHHRNNNSEAPLLPGPPPTASSSAQGVRWSEDVGGGSKLTAGKHLEGAWLSTSREGRRLFSVEFSPTQLAGPGPWLRRKLPEEAVVTAAAPMWL